MKKNYMLGTIICTLLILTACGTKENKDETVVEMNTKEDEVQEISESAVQEISEPVQESETEKIEEADEHAKNDENSISMEAYQNFIDSGEGLYFDIYDSGVFEKNKAYSFDEFFKVKKDNFTSVLYKYYDLEYAFIDCGNDGVKELLIRYAVAGEMSEYEGDYVFENAIKYIDGRLEVCAESYSHYRINEMINEYGIIGGAFVDYAGANVWSSEKGVDKNGNFHEIMISATSCAEAIPGMYRGYSPDEPDFIELSEVCNELGDNFYDYATEIKYDSTKDQKIFSYKLNGNENYKDAIEEVFNKANVNLLPLDEYDKALNKVIEEFGLTEESFYAGEPEFTAFSINDDSKELWKVAYEDYLFDLLTGKEYMHDFYTAEPLQGPDVEVQIALKDITEDGIPELWIYSFYGEDDAYGTIMTYKDGKLDDITGYMNYYYNPETKLLYANQGGYAEPFTVYRFENGSFVMSYTLWHEDGYKLIKSDNSEETISEDQANALVAEFESGRKKYTLEPITVNLDSVDEIIDQF